MPGSLGELVEGDVLAVRSTNFLKIFGNDLDEVLLEGFPLALGIPVKGGRAIAGNVTETLGISRVLR